MRSANNELVFGKVDKSNNDSTASNAMGLINHGTCQLDELAIAAPLGTTLDLELESPMASLTKTRSDVVTIRVAEECPPGNVYLAESQVCEPCPMSKYVIHFSPDAECNMCPDGAACAGGYSGNGLSTKRGWWRASFDSDEMWPCPMRENCLGGTKAEASACRKGSDGPLCGICQAGFFNDGRECAVCGNTTSNEFFYIVVLVCALCVALIWMVRKSVTVHVNKKTTWSDSLGSTLASLVDIQRAKIAWSTIQITAAIAWTTDIEWPEPFKSVSDMLTIIAELSLVPVACINRHMTYWDELILATVIPVGVVSLAWLAAAILPAKHSPRTKATRFTLFVAFVVLPMTSTKIFRTFLCLEFEDRTDLSMSESFLAVDLSIDCDGDLYAKMKLYASVSIAIFPIGIPLGFLAVIYSNRQAISCRDISQPCPPELKHIAILFEHYRNGSTSIYWEVIESVRRLLLSSVVVFMGRTSPARTTWGALLAIFFAVLCGEVQPCVDPGTQAFAFMSHWHVTIHFLLAVVLSAGFGMFSPLAVGTLFVILTLVIVLGAFAHGRKAKQESELNGVNKGVRRSVQKIKAQPCVMICAPGRTADSEMALALMRVLRDLGYLEPKAVIANLSPQQDRSKLVRQRLDALGLQDVPVGVGTNGGVVRPQNDEAVAAKLRKFVEASSSAVDSERAEGIFPGGKLLQKTWEEAAPASLVLLITSSLKVSHLYLCNIVLIWMTYDRPPTLPGCGNLSP